MKRHHDGTEVSVTPTSESQMDIAKAIVLGVEMHLGEDSLTEEEMIWTFPPEMKVIQCFWKASNPKDLLKLVLVFCTPSMRLYTELVYVKFVIKIFTVMMKPYVSLMYVSKRFYECTRKLFVRMGKLRSFMLMLIRMYNRPALTPILSFEECKSIQDMENVKKEYIETFLL